MPTTGEHHGWRHQQAKRAAMARALPTDPCALGCGSPLGTVPRTKWHLAHDDTDPTGQSYVGLAHAHCNQRRAHDSPRSKGHPWSRARRHNASSNGNTTSPRQPDPVIRIELDEWE